MKTHNLSDNLDNVENANTAFVCCECNNRFKDSMSLTKHMAFHTDKRKFECTKCSYTCNDKATLSKHEMKHNEEKPFECTECEYRTKYKSDLRVHMRGHTGEKPFVCSICQYSCIAASCLKQHMKSKHNKDPYECTECKFTSMFSSNLKLHMKSHTGDKKYICTKCGYKSATNVELKIHARTHFVEKRFECTDCEYKSASKATMKVHMLTHQNKKYEQAGKYWQNTNDTMYLKSDTDYKTTVCKSSKIADKEKVARKRNKLSVKRKFEIPMPSTEDFQSYCNETKNSKKRKLDNFPSISSELSIELVDIKRNEKIAKDIEDAGTSSEWNFNEAVGIAKKSEMSKPVKSSESSSLTVVKRKVGRPKKNYDNAISITHVINHPHSIFSSESIDKETEAHSSSDAIYIESVNICNAAAKSKRVRNKSSASSSENELSKSKKFCKCMNVLIVTSKLKRKVILNNMLAHILKKM
ncbi:unnamed protein product [Meganyctiphanes norvegica]|uniref:C2H2-type domain-containing protein n=1 Tax=Meganyctiphanes norvegica TaxID=48144 RepID=A0AAV2PPS1_MEGNR